MILSESIKKANMKKEKIQHGIVLIILLTMATVGFILVARASAKETNEYYFKEVYKVEKI
jgi:hypothetical protein